MHEITTATPHASKTAGQVTTRKQRRRVWNDRSRPEPRSDQRHDRSRRDRPKQWLGYRQAAGSTSPVLTRTVLTRTTTLRATVRHRSSEANRPDRSNAEDPGGSSCYSDTSRRATTPRQGGRNPPSPDPESAPLTRRGCALLSTDSAKAHHQKAHP
jgi:hypothetical protein